MDSERDEHKINEAMNFMKHLPFKDMGEVKLDTNRSSRTGFSEIIYCPGKSDEQLATIARALQNAQENVLFSRVSPDQHSVISSVLPDAMFYARARLTGIRRQESPHYRGVTVMTAGSSDVGVAEEAAITAEYMGCDVLRLYDVGVAGLHRLLSHVEELQASRAIVAVAGMEGALPTVVGGLVSCPVIAVPTSVGYGVSLGGIAPLLTMLNSCAMGVSVVNIDNGLGAGYFAASVVRQIYLARQAEPDPAATDKTGKS
ncbi:MAG: nickel pincer cofactor biosynthesis protein LarB [Synergistaceae bacterium]|jgi:NCAIR mutase (PurE)-related protein|nr:nickel pincer cofactor biosynthesis protein LarB [Synergistaceae bacterium]